MADSAQSHTNKPSASTDSRRNGGGNRHNSDSDHPPATLSGTPSKSENGTPAKASSAHSARLTNSTPRLRARPAPVRSLSTPLGRSLSMRVSKKEKRWSMRLEDLKSPVSSTYRDDYQSPEALYFQSLNLETTTTEPKSNAADPNAPTTYRESYQWRENRGLSRRRIDSNGTSKTNPLSPDHSSNSLPSSQRPMPPTKPVSRNGQASEQGSHRREELSLSQPVVQPPPSVRSSAYLKRNSSTEVSGTPSRHTLSSADRKSLSNENRVQVKPANENGASTTQPSNKNGQTVNREGLQSMATPPVAKLTNGIRGSNISSDVSENVTPRRSRAYQLQSSNGGSPFVYGSGSGSWV